MKFPPLTVLALSVTSSGMTAFMLGFWICPLLLVYAVSNTGNSESWQRFPFKIISQEEGKMRTERRMGVRERAQVDGSIQGKRLKF